MYNITNILINFTFKLVLTSFCSSTYVFVIFQHFFIFLSNCLQMLHHAGVQIMSNLGLLLKTVFCGDTCIKVMQNINFYSHLIFLLNSLYLSRFLYLLEISPSF